VDPCGSESGDLLLLYCLEDNREVIGLVVGAKVLSSYFIRTSCHVPNRCIIGKWQQVQAKKNKKINARLKETSVFVNQERKKAKRKEGRNESENKVRKVIVPCAKMMFLLRKLARVAAG